MLMLEELKDLNSSRTFKAWMTLLNGGIPYETITKEMLINGLCEDLVYYLHVKYGVRTISIINTSVCMLNESKEYRPMPTSGHYCILDLQGRYFDGYNTEGVSDINELHWVKEIQSSFIYKPNKPVFKHIDTIVKECVPDADHSWYLTYKSDLLEILNRG